MSKEFECKPKCENIKIRGINYECDKCIKHIMIPLTDRQKEKILEILNEKE